MINTWNNDLRENDKEYIGGNFFIHCTPVFLWFHILIVKAQGPLLHLVHLPAVHFPLRLVSETLVLMNSPYKLRKGTSIVTVGIEQNAESRITKLTSFIPADSDQCFYHKFFYLRFGEL